VKKLISVCCPAYNESECIDELIRRLGVVADALSPRYDFEFIVCENGSHDDTYEKLLRARERDPRVKVVRLARNFWAEGALTAALAHARGDAAVLMYSDLQDPPEYIPELVRKWEEGYKNVYAIVANRSGESPFRRALAKGYYAIVDSLSESPLPRNVSDFRLVERVAYQTFLNMLERYRVMRHMWPWMGFRSIGIETERPARGGGRSSFNFFGTFHSALRTILAQTRTPLVIIPMLGLGCAAGSFALLLFEVIRAVFFGVPFGGFGTIVALMLLLFGLLFVFLWMISEYVGMIFEEVRHRPVYVVSQTDGFDAREALPENRESPAAPARRTAV
jgi:glycosyltransferase involved in cell wall biosynthesis